MLGCYMRSVCVKWCARLFGTRWRTTWATTSIRCGGERTSATMIYCKYMNKNALMWALGVAVVATTGYFFFSQYLVSRLDGTGGVQTLQTTMQQYSSEDGVSFMYPGTYELSSR